MASVLTVRFLTQNLLRNFKSKGNGRAKGENMHERKNAMWRIRVFGVLVALISSVTAIAIAGNLGVFGPLASTSSHEPQKKDCDEYYPLPSDYPNWTNCKKVGGSACGGPQQCACDESQRLVTFKCDQGTYQQCYGEKGDGCKGN
jgi:hypothetical protein